MAETATPEITEIRPQPRQAQFLASPADICIFGGSAGGGKSYAMLLEPLRHIAVRHFGAVIFRRTIPEIVKEGGLWDEASRIYPLVDGKPNQLDHMYRFPSRARISFAHMQHETDKETWKSAQIALIEFDQLETFSAGQFFYMFSRNRSTCGVKPYIRATCNPEPGWLADFLAWWIAEDGYADLGRVGGVRWMIRENEEIIWADSRDELTAKYPGSLPKSVSFILSTIYDNQILLSKDPGYLSNLQALSYVDRERLLGHPERGGNWKVKLEAGKVFNRDWFEIIDALPAGVIAVVRFWDFAATEKKLNKSDPDYTASVKMAKVVTKTSEFVVILDCTSERLDPARTDTAVVNRASQDGKHCRVRWEQEGGASGKRDSYNLTTKLAGYDARGISPQGDKLTRAKPLAAQAAVGNVKLLRGAWNEAWLNHMHGQPELPHDDIMDASSGAYNDLAGGGGWARGATG